MQRETLLRRAGTYMWPSNVDPGSAAHRKRRCAASGERRTSRATIDVDGAVHSPAAIIPLNAARPVADAAIRERGLSVRDQIGQTKTAFVFAGGGSFGAIQVGMLHSLIAHGISADMVVGSSVGALNGAFYAGDPTLSGVEKLGDIWRSLTRQDVFPMSWRTLLSFLWRRDFLISHDGIRRLIEDHIPYRNL